MSLIRRSVQMVTRVQARGMAFSSSWADTIEDAKNSLGRNNIVSPQAASDFIKNNASVLIIDVQDSVADVIPGTHHISLGTLPFKACAGSGHKVAALADAPKDVPIVVTCGLGGQAIVGAKLLHDYGFWNVRAIEGGCLAWKNAGLPLKKFA